MERNNVIERTLNGAKWMRFVENDSFFGSINEKEKIKEHFLFFKFSSEIGLSFFSG